METDMTVGSPYRVILGFTMPHLHRQYISAALQYGGRGDRRQVRGPKRAGGGWVLRYADVSHPGIPAGADGRIYCDHGPALRRRQHEGHAAVRGVGLYPVGCGLCPYDGPEHVHDEADPALDEYAAGDLPGGIRLYHGDLRRHRGPGALQPSGQHPAGPRKQQGAPLLPDPGGFPECRAGSCVYPRLSHGGGRGGLGHGHLPGGVRRCLPGLHF